MAYTPPTGNVLVLDLGGAYSPPAGDALSLDLVDSNTLSLTPAAAAATGALDAVALTVTRDLLASAASSTASVDVVTAVLGGVLLVEDAAANPALAAVPLSITRALAPTPAISTPAIPLITAVISRTLTTAAVTSTCTIDTPAAVLAIPLTVATATAVGLVGTASLTVTRTLPPAAAITIAALDTVALTISRALTVADAAQAGAIDAAALSAVRDMSVADPSSTPSIDAVAASLLITLTVSDAASSSAVGSIALTITRPLSAADAASASAIDSLTAGIVIDPAYDSVRWSVVIALGGVDVSDALIDRLEIDAEESAARIAEFTLLPAAGSLDLAAWTHASVTIDYQLLDAAGNSIGQYRRFTGVVDVPDYDRGAGTIKFSCTDELQRVFEGQSRASIAAITGGLWSGLVFDPHSDAWNYAQDRMATQPYALDLSVTGTPTKTAWAAKISPDFTFSVTDILDDSLSITTPSARNLVNRVDLTLEYRYERLMQREVPYAYAPASIRYIDGMAAPTPGQIGQAARSSGWALEGTPVLGALPDAGPYTNSLGGEIVYLSDCPRYTYAGSALFTLAKRWTQTVTESYTVAVQAPVSVAGAGTLRDVDHVAITAGDLDIRPASWDKTREDTIDVQSYSGSPAAGVACSSWVDHHSIATLRYDQPAPEGMGVFAVTGDRYYDLDDRGRDGRAAFQTAFRTAVARARTKILASHRSGRVAAAILLNPLLDRIHTVRLATDRETVQGKIVRVRDVFDFAAGSAITEFELAVSQPLGSGTATDTPITDPPKPAFTQASEPFEPVAAGLLNSYFVAGGDAEMADDQQGWSPQLDEFRILTPAVDAANINHATASASYNFDVDIPADTFALEAA